MVFLSLNVITQIARPSSSGITPQNRKRLCSCGSTLSGRSITLMHHSFFRYGRFLRTSFSKYSVNLYPVVTMFAYYMLFWVLIEYFLRITAALTGDEPAAGSQHMSTALLADFVMSCSPNHEIKQPVIVTCCHFRVSCSKIVQDIDILWVSCPVCIYILDQPHVSQESDYPKVVCSCVWWIYPEKSGNMFVKQRPRLIVNGN